MYSTGHIVNIVQTVLYPNEIFVNMFSWYTVHDFDTEALTVRDFDTEASRSPILSQTYLCKTLETLLYGAAGCWQCVWT